MTKGRQYNPSSATQGKWFRHRGEIGDLEGKLRDATSTRTMLEAPFSAPAGPRTPPKPFMDRHEVIYNDNNPFTQHDNRHYFQEHGVYFGDGKDSRHLGRHLHPRDQRLHHTDGTFLHHKSRNHVLHDYNPVTATSYRTPGQTEQPRRRRFPKAYVSPESSELTTSTTLWPNVSYKTPMDVLAVSQEPYLKHNSWKYSNYGQDRVYPPFNRKRAPVMSNVLDRYGSDFASLPVIPSRTVAVPE